MKKIKLGTFYGYEMYIEVPEDVQKTEKEWQTMWENYLSDLKSSAVSYALDMYKLQTTLSPWQKYKNAWKVILAIR